MQFFDTTPLKALDIKEDATIILQMLATTNVNAACCCARSLSINIENAI